MFCGCRVEFGAEPNTNVCPVCLGHPGSLPVPNREAIARIIKIGLALDCVIAPHSLFHRKNYFYPDMPKNYQISQYDLPICVGGHLDVDLPDGDHEAGRHHPRPHGGGHGQDHARERQRPDPRGRVRARRLQPGGHAARGVRERARHPQPEEAGAYLRELRATLEALDVSDVRMEEGSLRCDANVSLRPVGQDAFGTKVEIKNMNSIRSLERALALRDRAPDEGAGERRGDRAGDPSLGRGRRRHQVDALQGGGLRLPLLPGARHPAARAVAGVDRGDPGEPAGAAARPARALRGRARASSPRSRASSWPTGPPRRCSRTPSRSARLRTRPPTGSPRTSPALAEQARRRRPRRQGDAPAPRRPDRAARRRTP